MNEMPQAFADAVCNMRCRLLRYSGNPDVVVLGEEHAMHRYRGFEGKNGVACDVCKQTARDLWAEYQRIVEKLT